MRTNWIEILADRQRRLKT